MKKTALMLCTVATLAACSQTDSPTEVESEVALWQGNATAAVSLTFDDHLINQFTVVQPMLDAHGMKGTFYPILSWVSDFSMMRGAVEAGHEIGCHTVTHPNLAQITAEEVENEYEQSVQITMDSLGVRILTIAYPFCSPPDSTLTEKYFVAARHCDGRIDNPSPADYMSISSFGVGSESQVTTAEGLEEIFERAVPMNGWATILFHEFDEGTGYSPFSSEEFNKALDYLSEKCDTFWVGTFADVARYAKERDAAEVKAVLEGNKLTISLTADLDKEIYNVPLTVRTALPEGWTTCSATQNGETVEANIDGNHLQFLIIPNAGDVVATK